MSGVHFVAVAQVHPPPTCSHFRSSGEGKGQGPCMPLKTSPDKTFNIDSSHFELLGPCDTPQGPFVILSPECSSLRVTYVRPNTSISGTPVCASVESKCGDLKL